MHLYPPRGRQSSTHTLQHWTLSVARPWQTWYASPWILHQTRKQRSSRRASIRHCTVFAGRGIKRRGWDAVFGESPGEAGEGERRDGGCPGRPRADVSAIPEINSLPARVRRRAGTVPAAPPLCNTPAGRGGGRGEGEGGYPFRRWAVPA